MGLSSIGTHRFPVDGYLKPREGGGGGGEPVEKSPNHKRVPFFLQVPSGFGLMDKVHLRQLFHSQGFVHSSKSLSTTI